MALADKNLFELPGAKRALATCGVLAVVAAALTVGQAVCLSVALYGLWQGQGLGPQTGYLALFALCFCLRAAVFSLRERYMGTFAQGVVHGLQSRLLETVYDQGKSAVSHFGAGALATMLTQGSAAVRNYLGIIIPKTADLMLQSIVFALVLLLADPISGVIALVVVPVIVFYMQLLGSYAKEKAASQYAAYQQLSNHFADSVKGIATLQDFGVGGVQEERVFETSETLREKTLKTLKTATMSSLVLDLFSVFALAAVAIMLGFRLMDGQVALLNALVVLIVMPELFAVIKRWSADFHASLDGKNHLQAMLDVARSARGGACGVAGAKVLGGPFDHFSVESLGYSYGAIAAEDPEFSCGVADCDQGQQAQNQNEQTASLYQVALRDISFEVPAHRCVGIIGASGAGKSTLAQLIAGFSDPSAGTFLIDGTPVPTLQSQAWRARVAYIPQHPHIFHASLRENVAFYCPDASDACVWEALESVGLAAFVRALPQGLDTIVGEGGVGISGGQAQRIALARVFADPKRDVVVFDEPTAHLDLETELALKPAMRKLMSGRTVFFATHRLHWVRDMDYVLVLEDGAVAAFGTPDQVVSDPSGAYARLTATVVGGEAHACA